MVLRICTWLSHCNCAWPYSFVAGRLVGVWLSKRPHIPALLFGFIKLHLLLSALFATKWSVPSAKWNQKTKFRFFCSCEIIINNLHLELNPGIRFFLGLFRSYVWLLRKFERKICKSESFLFPKDKTSHHLLQNCFLKTFSWVGAVFLGKQRQTKIRFNFWHVFSDSPNSQTEMLITSSETNGTQKMNQKHQSLQVIHQLNLSWRRLCY